MVIHDDLDRIVQPVDERLLDPNVGEDRHEEHPKTERDPYTPQATMAVACTIPP